MSSHPSSLGDGPISAHAGNPGTVPSQVSTKRPSTPAQASPPSAIPSRSPHRPQWLSDSSPASSARSLRFKSKSIAELSPTTANAKSLSLPISRRESTSVLKNPFTTFLGSLKGKAKALSEPELQYIGVTLPKTPDYPLSSEIFEQLEEVQFKVEDILEKHAWAVRNLEILEQDEEDSGSDDGEETTASEKDKWDQESEDASSQTRLATGKPCAQLPLLDGDGLSESAIEEAANYTIRIVERELSAPDSDSENTSSFIRSSNTSLASPNFAKSCPRIRKDEDIRDYSARLAQGNQPIANTDGTSDSSEPTMNNFSNFDNTRQAPQQPQQAAQMNGGLNGVTQWPNVGAQSDMNVLWEYIVKLSDMHEQIRAQTQSVASGMQQIDSMRAGGSGASSSGAPHVNGAVNGLPPSNTESAEIARLQTDLLSAHSKIEDLTAHITTLQTLNTDYENAISHTLDRLRPFAQSHAQALIAQKAHYLSLLEQERTANLELRLEQSRWQEKAREVKDMMVESLKAQGEMEGGYKRKIARLRSDNRSLRRICNVPLLEESEEEDEEKNGVATLESAQGVREHSARQSPELVRTGEGGGGDGGRIVIS